MFELVIISSLLGLSLGSFVNVCVYRLPRGISVVNLRSFCPQCQNNIGVLELIPVLGFFIAGGRCKNCGTRISFLYPAVELFVAGVVLIIFYQNGITLGTLELLVFFLLMLTVALIDWNHFVIPNQIVFAGLIAGIVIKGVSGKNVFIDAVLTSLLAFLALYAVRLLGNFFLKKQSMGWGDVKLAAVIGLFIGFQNFLIAVWLASVAGICFIVLLKSTSKWSPASEAFQSPILHSRSEIISKLPFGSFLAAASVFVFFFQQPIQGLIDTWLIWNL